ncbi:MAG TPA: malate/lactate/ureidoglycolate dehydrogenase [Burkholderiaceae bacterium]|nr:malate/lactate/ureidoglycolate dehydrogenase [Burkholderiaceae bacterium]
MAYTVIHPEKVHRWMTQLWLRAGSDEREARLTADHLVGANLAGHDSHGIGMAPRYVKSWKLGELQLNRGVAVGVDNGALITVDARHGMGQSVTWQAMQLAIARAREHGVCVMGLRNSHHLGRVGHWAEQAIAAGMASVHFTNAVASTPMVAPHGGGVARFLTNPFTVGIPRPGGEPFVLDFATSAIAHGKVRVAWNKKKSDPTVEVPEGSLIDALGRPTRDPNVMFEPPEGPHGALQTAAAHKGYALAMVCELLGAALTGGATAAPSHRTMQFAIWNSMLAIVFDPTRIGPAERFAAEAREFCDWVQSASLSGATDRIMMPGDPERRSRAERAQGLPIDPGTLAELDEAARIVDPSLPALSSLA